MEMGGMMRKSLLSFTWLMLVLHSCGSPVIRTGRNAEPPSNPVKDGVPKEGALPETTPSEPSTSSAPSRGGSTTSGGEVASPGSTASGPTAQPSVATSGRITCFGKSADVAPSELEAFCSGIPQDLQEYYAQAHKILCVEKKLHNLFLPQCGWSGTGALANYLRVLDSTPLNDAGDEFYYLSAASLTIGPTSHSYPEVALLAYSDPESFRKRFILAGAEITPDGSGIVQQGETRQANYHFAVMGLTKTSFVGQIRVVDYGKNLRAVFNTALRDFQGLKARRNLTLVTPLADGREKLVIIEERLIPDGGQHQIAWSKMLKLDQVELENRLNNSKVP
jgi:hypothetical protein